MCQICVENVSFKYNNSHAKLVLDSVSFTADKGDVIALKGQSGSGKTTFLNILGGLIKPTNGTVKVCNLSLEKAQDNELAVFRNSNIGFIFQSFYLDPQKTVWDNILLPLYFSDMSFHQGRKKAQELLELTELTDKRFCKVSQISGGQQQRVAFARALINDPKILLADEPTGHLDKKTWGPILELLEKLNRQGNLTIILTTHDDSVSTIANKVFQIENGRLETAPESLNAAR